MESPLKPTEHAGSLTLTLMSKHNICFTVINTTGQQQESQHFFFFFFYKGAMFTRSYRADKGETVGMCGCLSNTHTKTCKYTHTVGQCAADEV